MKNKILIAITTMLGIFACDKKDDSENLKSCEQLTLISSELYANAPNDALTINSLEIDKDQLKIKFSSSGCDGGSWEVKLIDSGDIMESDPPQRNLRLSLKNEELCDAYFMKEFTFDISNLKVNGNKVKLNITNSNKDILYEY